MAYWTIRRGEYRNGERYIGENIDRIRHNTGRADLPIHPIGGIADGATVADLEGMIRAVGRSGRPRWEPLRLGDVEPRPVARPATLQDVSRSPFVGASLTWAAWTDRIRLP